MSFRLDSVTSDMTRTHRERLLKNGFIREVMKGWYIPSRPDEVAGESTAWYTSFWGFARDYLNSRFSEAAEDDYSAWYRELFAPSVVAGIIGAADLAGYRHRPVTLASDHTKPYTKLIIDDFLTKPHPQRILRAYFKHRQVTGPLV